MQTTSRLLAVVAVLLLLMAMSLPLAAQTPAAVMTIRVEVQPQSGTNFRITSSVLAGGPGSDAGTSINPFYLDDPASDDGDAFSDSAVFVVPQGAIYSFTWQGTSGYQLTAIDCPGTLPSRTMTVDTSGGDITCTFTVSALGTLNVNVFNEKVLPYGQQSNEPNLGGFTVQVSTAGGLYAQGASNSLGRVSFKVPPATPLTICVARSGWTAVPSVCNMLSFAPAQVLPLSFGVCQVGKCP